MMHTINIGVVAARASFIQSSGWWHGAERQLVRALVDHVLPRWLSKRLMNVVPVYVCLLEVG